LSVDIMSHITHRSLALLISLSGLLEAAAPIGVVVLRWRALGGTLGFVALGPP
jgi:uncharacterized membrane protein